MALQGERPDEPVPEAPFPLLDRHRADAIPLAQPVSDASACAHPDEAVDAPAPARVDARYAGKLAVPAPDGQVSGAQLLPPRTLPEAATALCKLGAAPFAA